jgi:nucleotide-binding universal stress UspA family protein
LIQVNSRAAVLSQAGTSTGPRAEKEKTMSWKTIATIVTDYPTDEATLEAAAEIAARSDAHLEITCLGIDPTHPETWLAGAHALAVSLPSTLAEAERLADDLAAQVRGQMQRTDARWSVRPVLTHLMGLTLTVAQEAQFADLVVAGRPYGAGTGPTQVTVVEAALFAAGVPVLVVPPSGLPGHFSRVMLAWNDSPEALRAARAALPVMAEAEATAIVIVDPPMHGPDRSDPGGRLAEVLARHGVRPEVRVLARTEMSLASMLGRHVRETGADLLVMGAYGHSRLRESILGGATREMLEAAAVPVLMMH